MCVCVKNEETYSATLFPLLKQGLVFSFVGDFDTILIIIVLSSHVLSLKLERGQVSLPPLTATC